MTPTESSPRVVVAGAGIAGLTAGFRLKQAGYDVTVLESANAVAAVHRNLDATAREIISSLR